MTKYTIVGFAGTANPPQIFNEHDWPLHVTLLDTFKSHWTQDELIGQVEQFAQGSKPFDLFAEKKGLLGPDKDVSVKLLKLDKNLREFHDGLVRLGKVGGFVYNTPDFVASGFVPHITDEKSEQASLNMSYPLTNITLIDMIPGGDKTKRSIVATFKLGT